MKNAPQTTQNALAPGVFTALSIVLKLGTPLLHTQAQNTLLQIFNVALEVEIWTKPPKALFYPYPTPPASALATNNFFHRSKLKKSVTIYFSPCIDKENKKKNRNKIGAKWTC